MGPKLNTVYNWPPNIYWIDKNIIIYYGMPILLTKFQFLVQNIISKAEKVLNKLIFGILFPDIDLNFIIDLSISTTNSRKNKYSLFYNKYI
jgi:hypothetical protein